MELPKEFKGTIYFYWNTKHEWFLVSDVDGVSRDEHIKVGELKVDIEFDINREAAVKQIVDGLQAEKKTIQAKAQSDINKLDEKINSLLAITHQVEGE